MATVVRRVSLCANTSAAEMMRTKHAKPAKDLIDLFMPKTPETIAFGNRAAPTPITHLIDAKPSIIVAEGAQTGKLCNRDERLASKRPLVCSGAAVLRKLNY